MVSLLNGAMGDDVAKSCWGQAETTKRPWQSCSASPPEEPTPFGAPSMNTAPVLLPPVRHDAFLWAPRAAPRSSHTIKGILGMIWTGGLEHDMADQGRTTDRLSEKSNALRRPAARR